MKLETEIKAQFSELFPKADDIQVDVNLDDAMINVAIAVLDDESEMHDFIGYTAMIIATDSKFVFTPNTPWDKTHPIIKL